MGTAPGACLLRSGVGSRRGWEDVSCIGVVFHPSVLFSGLARLPDVSTSFLALFLTLVLLGRVFSHSGQGGVG